VGLVGVLIGAVIAAAVQVSVRRSEGRDRWTAELLQSCAEIYALESTFRTAADRVERGGSMSLLENWPRSERRVAEAKVLLLTTDDELARALSTLTDAGKRRWRSVRDEPHREDARRGEHYEAMLAFSDTARRAIQRGAVLRG
jgi:hypothetical protein